MMERAEGFQQRVSGVEIRGVDGFAYRLEGCV